MWVVPRHAQLDGQRVHLGEGDLQGAVGQQVWVVADHVHRHVAEPLIEGHGGGQGQLVLGQKFRQTAHPHLLPEILADGPGPFGGHAADFTQPLRIVLNDGQGVLPETVHDLPCQPHADPLHRSGGQIFKHRLLPHGHTPHHHLRLELFAVAGVAAPGALQLQRLAGGHAGHAAHRCDLSPFGAVQLEHGVAVLLVAEQHGGHRARHLVLPRQRRHILRHGQPSNPNKRFM